MERPGDTSSRYVVASTEESHDLVSNRFESKSLRTLLLELLVMFNNGGDDVFTLCTLFGLSSLRVEDLGCHVDNDPARYFHIAVHFSGDLLGAGDKGLNSVQNA